MSRRRCADQHWTEFQKADATKLPYPNDSFDAAVSTQVYEYVADVSAALTELHRVVRPGGRVVVVDTDYGSLVLNTDNGARMEQLARRPGGLFLPPASGQPQDATPQV